MGSDLYSVRASRKDGRKVTLDIRCIHPDVLHVIDDAGFALMLLMDATPYGETSPLVREISVDDVMDSAWARQFALGFVRGLRVLDVRDAPPPGAKGDGDHPYWSGAWLSWRLEVEVSHAAWVKHIDVGDDWVSRAFEPAWEYDAHPPIEPTPDMLMDDPEGMFVWVPRECFSAMLLGWAELPSLLELPTYSETHYSPSAQVQVATLTPEDRAWVGRPVWTRSKYGDEAVGCVARIPKEGAVEVVTMGVGSCGLSDRAEVMGVPLPKTKRRPAERLTYAEIFKFARTTVTRAVRRGDRVELTLRVPPDGRALPIKSATDALGILIEPSWWTRDNALRPEPGALVEALIADGVEREIEGAHRTKTSSRGWRRVTSRRLRCAATMLCRCCPSLRRSRMSKRAVSWRRHGPRRPWRSSRAIQDGWITWMRLRRRSPSASARCLSPSKKSLARAMRRRFCPMSAGSCGVTRARA